MSLDERREQQLIALIGRVEELEKRTFGVSDDKSPKLSSDLNFSQKALKWLGSVFFKQEYDLGDSGTAKTVDWRVANNQEVTLTGDCTFTFIDPDGPCHVTLIGHGDGTNRTLTWPASVIWISPEPTWEGTSGKKNVFSAYFDGEEYLAAGSYEDYAGVAGIENVVEDTTPQLGGNLDGQGYGITAIDVLDIAQSADGSAIQIDGYDDKSSDNIKLYLNAQGNAYIEATQHLILNPSTTSVIVDTTATEALLVRQNSDAGDVFIVDTTNNQVELCGTCVVGSASINVNSGGQGTVLANSDLLMAPTAGWVALRSADSDIYLDLGDAAGAEKIIVRDSGYATVATIDSDGEAYFASKVGVADSNPVYMVDIIQDGDSNGLQIQGFDDVSAEYLRGYITAAGLGVVVASNGLYMYSGNVTTSNMLLDSSQHIYMRVGDTAGADKFYFQDSGNATIATIDSDGRAGFGGGEHSSHFVQVTPLGDNQGVIVLGYDDKSAEYGVFYVNSGGNTVLSATESLNLQSADEHVVVKLGDAAGAKRFIVYDSAWQIIIDMDSNGSIKMRERASAKADTAGMGQLWVKNTTPCELWFTDDAGTDTQIV